MSFPLSELSTLLNPDPALLGRVMRIDNGTVQAATERGLVTVRTLELLAIGDRVVIRQGLASRAPKPARTFPV